MKYKAIPLLLLILTVLSSCVTYQACVDKFGTLAKDSVKAAMHVRIDTVLITRPDSVQGGMNADTLVSLIRVLQAHKGKVDSLVHISSDGKAQVKFWFDKYTDAIKYRVDCIPDTIPIHITRTVYGKCPPAVIFDPYKTLPWYYPKSLWHSFEQFSSYILLAVIFLYIASRVIKLI